VSPATFNINYVKKSSLKTHSFLIQNCVTFVQQAYVIRDYMYEMLNISETSTYKVNMTYDFI